MDDAQQPYHSDANNSAIIWSIWQKLHSSELVPREVEPADTMSVMSYESSFKRTPSYAFPARKSLYADVIRVRADQNKARVRYCSTAPILHPTQEEDITVYAKSSTLCEPTSYTQAKVALYHESDTFLTEMPELYTYENPTAESSTTKISMPAFLPTIQAKTITRNSEGTASSAVRKYLKENDLSNTKKPTTPHASFSERGPTSTGELSSLRELEKSVLQNNGTKSRANANKFKKHKSVKHRTRCKPTGNHKKKVGKLYLGRNRELSADDGAPTFGINSGNSSTLYHSFVTPRDDLITHFSRISMRHVQATLNSNKLAILPNI